MLILENTPQGSVDWIVARLWRLTGSEMKRNITSTGKLSRSQASVDAVDKLIAGIDAAKAVIRLYKEAEKTGRQIDEWELGKFIAHYTGDKFKGSLHTERGNELEPDAIAALSEKIGMPIVDVGMCIIGDHENGVISCSPDGLIYDARGILSAGAELKCPTKAVYYGIVADDVLPEDYKLQVHSSMAICEVDIWHFGAYFKNEPIFYKQVRRDAFTDTVQKSLQEFQGFYADRFAAVKKGMAALNADKPLALEGAA